MLIDPEPMLPTRGYNVLRHDATLIDLEAEGMWPMGTQLEFTVSRLPGQHTEIRSGRVL